MSYTDIDPPRAGGFGPGGFRSGFGPGTGHRHRPEAPEGWERGLRRTWIGRAEDWLDERGKGAWIAAMVLGFILFWPVGLALLAYMIWSKRMFTCSHRRHGGPFRDGRLMGRHPRFRSSGNTAFDAYKADTLRRLEEEQEAFESFLDRLRAAKDKREFDEFMEERAARARSEGPAESRGEDRGGEQGPQPA